MTSCWHVLVAAIKALSPLLENRSGLEPRSKSIKTPLEFPTRQAAIRAESPTLVSILGSALRPSKAYTRGLTVSTSIRVESLRGGLGSLQSFK